MKRAERGITLIELLVALMITAFIGVAAFQSIRGSSEAGEQVRQVSEQVGQMQQLLAMMRDDLANYQPRDIVNDYGVPEASIQGGYQAGTLVEITRGGVYRSDKQFASSLARVGYRLEGEQLWRDQWWQVDRVSDDTKQSQPLIDGVQGVTIVFLARQSGRVTEYERWGTEQLESGVFAAPIAVRITIEHEQFGEVTQLVQLINQPS